MRSTPSHASRWLLLIEDNPADVQLFELALQELSPDAQLTAFHDGLAAIDALRQRGQVDEARVPDAILLDLELQRRGGLDVLSELKRDPLLRRVPVYVLTSSALERRARAVRLCRQP